MSASSVCVTCGTLSHERCRKGPESLLIRERDLVSTGPNFEKSCVGPSGIAEPPAAGAAAGPALPPQCGLDILLGEASLLAAAFQPDEVDTKLACQPPHAGTGVDADEVVRDGRRQARR